MALQILIPDNLVFVEVCVLFRTASGLNAKLSNRPRNKSTITTGKV